jgi:hypoxanthine phosphoribosyltransferase
LQTRKTNKQRLQTEKLIGYFSFVGKHSVLQRYYKKLKTDFSLDFIRVASYKDKKSTNNIELISSVRTDVRGKDVLIIEDIYDTGKTLSYIKNMLLKKKVKSLKTCVLVKKKTTKQEETGIDYVGFNIKMIYCRIRS